MFGELISVAEIKPGSCRARKAICLAKLESVLLFYRPLQASRMLFRTLGCWPILTDLQIVRIRPNRKFESKQFRIITKSESERDSSSRFTA